MSLLTIGTRLVVFLQLQFLPIRSHRVGDGLADKKENSVWYGRPLLLFDESPFVGDATLGLSPADVPFRGKFCFRRLKRENAVLWSLLSLMEAQANCAQSSSFTEQFATCPTVLPNLRSSSTAKAR